MTTAHEDRIKALDEAVGRLRFLQGVYGARGDGYGARVEADLDVALSALQSERLRGDEAERLAYVPGVKRCAKCNLRLVSTAFLATSGDISADNSPQACPNGCGPMWRISERDAGNQMIDLADEATTRAEAAEFLLALVAAGAESNARWRDRARNHAETLRGIRAMDPATEGDRMVLWASDGLSGYTDTVEGSLKEALERAQAAESQLSALKDEVEGLRGGLKKTVGPLQYAYRSVASVTADRVNNEILPAIDALLSTPLGGGGGEDKGVPHEPAVLGYRAPSEGQHSDGGRR